MMDLKLGNLLLEMRKNYTELPVFLFTEKGETAKQSGPFPPHLSAR